ncbi:hypothetical protein BDZ89DRAFT_1129390 [Hymenopellis radicata]|nr:hypothetical protein BDZ89DRAFT_1129390 [Hymenopellis radicata]
MSFGYPSEELIQVTNQVIKAISAFHQWALQVLRARHVIVELPMEISPSLTSRSTFSSRIRPADQDQDLVFPLFKMVLGRLDVPSRALNTISMLFIFDVHLGVGIQQHSPRSVVSVATSDSASASVDPWLGRSHFILGNVVGLDIILDLHVYLGGDIDLGTTWVHDCGRRNVDVVFPGWDGELWMAESRSRDYGPEIANSTIFTLGKAHRTYTCGSLRIMFEWSAFG